MEESDAYFVLILFMLKKKSPCPQKNFKRFWLREIFKKRAADELYNNLVHDMQIRDREFHFKQVFRMIFLARFPNYIN